MPLKYRESILNNPCIPITLGCRVMDVQGGRGGNCRNKAGSREDRAAGAVRKRRPRSGRGGGQVCGVQEGTFDVSFEGMGRV